MDTKAFKDRVVESCSKVIVGKDEKIELMLVAFLCNGHLLLEDRPGTGKTMLLRTFSKVMGGAFSRIQFTPDLLPSDVTGIHFYNQKTSAFEFRPGPLFANFVLADEINRATPRTQSALLEAMEERQITVDGKTFVLDSPFMVMASQNPLESYGTFPLPDAQLDRFFMRLSLGYMERAQELSVIARPSSLSLLEKIDCSISKEEIDAVVEAIESVHVSDDVLAYVMDIVEATRKENNFVSGVSTRGAIALFKASKAYACLQGRDYVIPEDVKKVAVPVLAHRLNLGSGMKSGSAERMLEKILDSVSVPLETL